MDYFALIFHNNSFSRVGWAQLWNGTWTPAPSFPHISHVSDKAAKLPNCQTANSDAVSPSKFSASFIIIILLILLILIIIIIIVILQAVAWFGICHCKAQFCMWTQKRWKIDCCFINVLLVSGSLFSFSGNKAGCWWWRKARPRNQV